ncbi:MAG: type I-F CRISPR-associated protein Csy3 [Candidatus Methylumidiphilus sp.]
MAKTEQLKTASVLAFERKLDPSDALFQAGKWDDRDNGKQWPTVNVREKAIRGTISNRLKDKDLNNAAKLDAEIQNPNLQRVDVATLPNEPDTLRVRFTLRVLGGAGAPSACNNADYQAKLYTTVQQYVETIGFAELANRYAVNIANGRFLWRNRVGAEQVEVRVSQLEKGRPGPAWVFDALNDFSLRNFDAPTKQEEEAKLQALAQVIEQGLKGDGYALLDVVAYARLGEGQEAYPSQEFISPEKGNASVKGDKNYKKSKTLYTVGEVAAIHSQKIGNALRTVDTWYPNENGANLGPIAVEPYGSVTSQGKAYRQPKEKADFYTLLDNWVLRDKAPAKVGDQHYVIANLVRGGVFGASEKD